MLGMLTFTQVNFYPRVPKFLFSKCIPKNKFYLSSELASILQREAEVSLIDLEIEIILGKLKHGWQ